MLSSTEGFAHTTNNKIDVFPLPFSNYLNVGLPDVEHQAISVVIMDELGRSVYKAKVEERCDFQLDVSILQHGIYYLSLQTRDFMAMKKIVK